MKYAIFLSVGVLAAGCNENEPAEMGSEVAANRPAASANTPVTSKPRTDAPATGAAPNAPGAAMNAPAATADNAAANNAAADNTDKNERDRSGAALTPGDQGGSEADRTITQRVRQGVMDADSLSVTGKNVKIITVDGVVTLRGPVKTAAEKAAIASIAQGVSGVKRVDNQLETDSN